MFGKRICASGKSAVESSTIAVFSRGQVHRLPVASPARADRGDDLVERLVLAEAVDGARRHQCVELSRARRGGQADDGDLREHRVSATVASTPSMPGSRKSMTHDVGPELAAGVDGGVALRDGADDLDPLLQLEQQVERLPEDVVVLDEQDADRLRLGLHARHHTPYSADRSSG